MLKAKLYAEKMEDGTMLPVNIAVMTMPSGVQYLVNGQHTNTSIIIYGKPFPACVDYYKCETETDAWILYGQFDTQGQRTEGHIYKAARGLMKCDKLRDQPLRVLQACGSALFYISAGIDGNPDFSATASNKTDKIELLDENSEVVLLASFLMGSQHKSNPLLRVGVVTAIIKTLKANEKKASEFWTAVSTGERLERNDPQYRLREWLREPSHQTIRHIRGVHVTQYACCVLWWNSYITGERRHITKLAALKELPEMLG
jgi:hypothetical protein